MQKAANVLRGSVCIEIEGKYPERFVNMCAVKNISFWDLQHVSDTVYHACVSINGYIKIRPLAEPALCTVRCIGRRGLPFFIWKVRKRYILLAGLLLVWAALWLSSLFIWDFEVSGNKEVSSEKILAALEEAGVKIGSFGPKINQEDIRSKVLLQLHGLSWITVNVSGSKAEVIVRERVEKPEMIDESMPSDVVAVKSGIITKINVYRGSTQLKSGDTVMEGDILVNGIIENASSNVRNVHAMADVYARTWYELSAQIPVQYGEKCYTGEEHSCRALIFFGNRMNLYFSSGISYTNCDKITVKENASLPGGVLKFLGTVTETYKEYDIVMRNLSIEDAENLLSPRLYDRLLKQIDGEIVSGRIESNEENGIITVTLFAECEEQIAKVCEIDE